MVRIIRERSAVCSRLLLGKRGVSEIVSYVLLISITFAISGMIYAWLVFYVTPGQEVKCDEGISLTIRSYVYNCTASPKTFNITLQNRGLFDIDGYVIRVNNQTGSQIGVYTLNKNGTNISTGVTYTDYYSNATNLAGEKVLGGQIQFIEIQPFTKQGGNLTVYCNNIAEQKISCS